MRFVSWKTAARIVLGLAALAGGLWLWSFDYGRKVSTDVLDLIPANEREPELALVRQMAGERVARVVLFALDFNNGETPDAIAQRERAVGAFIGSLQTSPAFAEVVRMGDTQAFASIGTYVFAHRFELLFPGRLASWKKEYAATDRSMPFDTWAAEKTARDLSAYLAKPEAVAFQDLLPSDPLLLAPGALEPWQAFSQVAGSPGRRDRVLIWARASASPLREEGQGPVAVAVASAEKTAQAQGAFTLRWTSVGRFAEASRNRIQAEMSWLNSLSLCVVLGIGFLGVRRPLKALNLAPVLVFSLLGAWMVTTSLFAHVHILVFVIGSLLGGVAVDYGFYLFLQPPLAPDEPSVSKAQRLLKPLLTSSLTAVTGFLLLVWSDLPLIRQLGIFVSTGLICAFVAAYLWFLQSKDLWWDTRTLIRARLPRRRQHPMLVGFAVVAVLVIAVGFARLHWRDDIRDLDIASPELRRNAGEVQAMFGDTDDRTIYLSRGATAAEAREAMERFHAWHATAFPGSALASVGNLLPRPEAWKCFVEERGQLEGFAPALRAALTAQGFDAGAFESFFEAWEKARQAPLPAYDALALGLRGALTGSVGLMMETTDKGTWFATLANHAEGAVPPAATATVSSGQLESFNRLFARYRASALRLSGVGLGVVGLSVLLVYGWRKGLAIFAVPAGSCLFAFGVLGLVGQTLNLFHLLGAFLGVCLSHNYAIFSAENAAKGAGAPPSIRLSALTTASSFGVLALSHIVVIASLGLMVALIVITALLIVELEPFSSATIRQGGEIDHINAR